MVAKEKRIIKHEDEGKEYFQWLIITALHYNKFPKTSSNNF